MTAAMDNLLAASTLANRRRSLLRLGPTLGRHRGRFLLVLSANAASQGGLLGAALAAAWLVGVAAGGAAAGELVTPLLVLLIAVTVRVAAVWWEMWIAHDLAYRIMADIRLDVFDGLERLAPGWLLGKRTGDLGAAAMSDVESLEWFYAHAVAQFAVLAATPIGAVLVLGVADWRLAAALGPFVVAIATVPFWLARRADRQGSALRSRLGALHADAVDAVQGLRELVSFGAAGAFRTRLRDRSQRLANAQRAHGSRSGLEAAAGDLLVAAAMVTVLAVAAALAGRGQLRPSLTPVVAILAGAALGPVTEIVGGVRNLGVLRAAASRVYGVVDARAQVLDRAGALRRIDVELPGVRFDRVHFRYTNGLPEVLCGATFDISPGETVALVGHSGAGKSTCAHLLLRFWDVQGGAVFVGGVDVRDVTQVALRDTISLVPQDSYLFNLSIAENIRLGNPSAGDAEVLDAARRAQVSEFADELPDGLDTMVGERGAALSGGQRQRIAIARALVRNAPILVLDEAVSNVDALGERLLRTALDEARSGRTTLIIAHRLSTIRDADRVVVLEEGRIVGDAPHAALVATSDTYRRLIATQLRRDVGR